MLLCLLVRWLLTLNPTLERESEAHVFKVVMFMSLPCKLLWPQAAPVLPWGPVHPHPSWKAPVLCHSACSDADGIRLWEESAESGPDCSWAMWLHGVLENYIIAANSTKCMGPGWRRAERAALPRSLLCRNWGTEGRMHMFVKQPERVKLGCGEMEVNIFCQCI